MTLLHLLPPNRFSRLSVPSDLGHSPSNIAPFWVSPEGVCLRRLRSRSEVPLLRCVFLQSNIEPRPESRKCSVFASEQQATGVEELGKKGDRFVAEVVAIGSRKDALIDFCLESPVFDSSSVRFWTIHMEGGKVELHQKSTRKGLVQANVGDVLSAATISGVLILVASAGYGSDIFPATHLLSSMRSLCGFSVGIILKPFSFEGKRRQSEVEDLVKKLRDSTNLCMVVETNALLQREAITLAEAMTSANNAVMLSIVSTYVLFSERHPKFLSSSQYSIREIKCSEAFNLVKSHGEAKVGYGAGHDIKSTIKHSILECEFLTYEGLQEPDGTISCIIASATALDKRDLRAFVNTFRQTSQCSRSVILSYINEPNLDPGVFLTALIIPSSRKQTSPKENFWSRVVHHIPLLFPFIGRTNTKSGGDPPAQLTEKTCSSAVVQGSSNRKGLQGLKEGRFVDTSHESSGSCVDEPFFENNSDETLSLSETDDSEIEQTYSEPSPSPDHDRVDLVEGTLDVQMWMKEYQATQNAVPINEQLFTFSLPIGVKQFKTSSDTCIEPKTSDTGGEENDRTSWKALADAGIEALIDSYTSPSSLNRKNDGGSRKPGSLSQRAAYMLESQRDSPNKWARIVEMKYRGGIYTGHCNGGFPEGKGRLSYDDGSFYDGMWHHGKKSGAGSFYYVNGDIFQGSWRDDLIHGKGWFYFHTGDRWYCNFWKGKANGKGRFYSKDGSIYFGHFQDGWRHGQSLNIDADGTRWIEIWDAGVLMSREQMDSDCKTGLTEC